MSGVDNGLTLEGLAQRLDEQGRENAERLNALERENARLRDEVAAFRGSDTGCDGVGGVLSTRSAPRAEDGAEDGESQATEVPEGRMNRRRLLKGAAAAAAHRRPPTGRAVHMHGQRNSGHVEEGHNDGSLRAVPTAS
jgi:hypothetical protein